MEAGRVDSDSAMSPVGDGMLIYGTFWFCTWEKNGVLISRVCKLPLALALPLPSRCRSSPPTATPARPSRVRVPVG